MIISKTPYRISLFGGGTDLPVFFKKQNGTTIGFAINKYSFISLKKISNIMPYNYRVVYSKHELANHLNKIQHPSVRETLKYYSVNYGIELIHSGDLPAMSGMGSSSSFTVGLCNIIRKINNEKLDKYDLAYEAIDIEQNKIKENVGSQDQVFASFGGLNKIIFLKDGTININKIYISSENEDLLSKSSFLLFTGKVRFASKIEKNKIKAIRLNKDKYFALSKFKEFVKECEKILNLKKIDIKLLGKLLEESWNIKNKITKDITSAYLDSIYNKAKKLGVYGGKLLGAGGGGFFYFICDQNKRDYIIKKLNLPVIKDINIDEDGSKIIFENKLV